MTEVATLENLSRISLDCITARRKNARKKENVGRK